jgi:hypothetical protein
MPDISVQSRRQYVLGLVLNITAITASLAVLVGWAAIALYYIGPIRNEVTRKLFSAIYAVVGLWVAVMTLGCSRRLLRGLFGC